MLSVGCVAVGRTFYCGFLLSAEENALLANSVSFCGVLCHFECIAAFRERCFPLVSCYFLSPE
jgi:hypothetical protein